MIITLTRPPPCLCRWTILIAAFLHWTHITALSQGREWDSVLTDFSDPWEHNAHLARESSQMHSNAFSDYLSIVTAGPAQKKTVTDIERGRHSLTLQLFDSIHLSLIVIDCSMFAGTVEVASHCSFSLVTKTSVSG